MLPELLSLVADWYHGAGRNSGNVSHKDANVADQGEQDQSRRSTAPPSATGSSDHAPSGWSGEGGTIAYTDDVIEVRTGVTLRKDGQPLSFVDAIEIAVKGVDPHVVQFVFREIIDSDGVPCRRLIHATTGHYETTTDPDDPAWNTDSAARPNPYYETAGAARVEPGRLTIYDQPALRPEPGETWRATFRTFAVIAGRVVRDLTWVRCQTHGETASYTVAVVDATELPSWATELLEQQGFDPVP